LTFWSHFVEVEGLTPKLPLSSTWTSPLFPRRPLLSFPLACRTPVLFAPLPVWSTPCSGVQLLELPPPPVTVNVWLASPLSTPCSELCPTCAMAGAAATNTIASIDTNIINFFNSCPSFTKSFLHYSLIVSSPSFTVNSKMQLFSIFLKTS
jgi:hypothetical protein